MYANVRHCRCPGAVPRSTGLVAAALWCLDRRDAGAAGKRFALPNARVMIHQPLAGMRGTAEDIMIHAKEFKNVKKRLNQILLEHTGQPLDKIDVFAEMPLQLFGQRHEFNAFQLQLAVEGGRLGNFQVVGPVFANDVANAADHDIQYRFLCL